ncbi:MAG: Fe-S cluster assembly sulfur transfer protein SufU [Opitutales bacterium]
MDAALQEELRREIILDHHRHPRNQGFLTEPAQSARGENPGCVDELTVYVQRDAANRLTIRFIGQGCALSQASASTLTELLQQRPADEAAALAERFCAALTGASDETLELDTWGDAAALEGAKGYPQRVKCATLAWRTFLAALRGEADVRL